MEAHESHEIIEQAEEAKHKSCNWTALAISVIAMILAINHVGGNNASKEATRHNIEASNYYAFYQAKSIKQHETQLVMDAISREISKMEEESGKKVEGPLGKFRGIYAGHFIRYVENIARYESDEQSGEGKKQLLEKANAHEAERDHALKQDPWFDYAEGILQIGIVLLSISILASLPALAIFGGVLGVLGTACMLNGFFLFFLPSQFLFG